MSGLAWRWIFWVNVPIGVAVLAVGLTRLARSPKVSARIDLAGMLLGAFAVGAIAYAVQEGPTVGWTSEQVLTAGIGGLVLAGATLAWERRCAYPMVPPGLPANRSFAAAAAGRFCLGVALYGAGFLFPQFLQLLTALIRRSAGSRARWPRSLVTLGEVALHTFPLERRQAEAGASASGAHNRGIGARMRALPTLLRRRSYSAIRVS